MPRRARVTRRPVIPDARYHSQTVARIINKVMRDGKKSTAERIVYRALDVVQEQARANPVDVLDQAIRNVTPMLEVKPRRVGGATYQVPIEIRGERRNSLAIRWLVNAARTRGGRSMEERLAAEVMDASRGQGAALRRREETHRMAEANRAFVHYRW